MAIDASRLLTILYYNLIYMQIVCYLFTIHCPRAARISPTSTSNKGGVLFNPSFWGIETRSVQKCMMFVFVFGRKTTCCAAMIINIHERGHTQSNTCWNYFVRDTCVNKVINAQIDNHQKSRPAVIPTKRTLHYQFIVFH